MYHYNHINSKEILVITFEEFSAHPVRHLQKEARSCRFDHEEDVRLISDDDALLELTQYLKTIDAREVIILNGPLTKKRIAALADLYDQRIMATKALDVLKRRIAKTRTQAKHAAIPLVSNKAIQEAIDEFYCY